MLSTCMRVHLPDSDKKLVLFLPASFQPVLRVFLHDVFFFFFGSFTSFLAEGSFS